MTSRPCTTRLPVPAVEFKYRPTTSISLSSNCGSLESLNVLTRWGFQSPKPGHLGCVMCGPVPSPPQRRAHSTRPAASPPAHPRSAQPPPPTGAVRRGHLLSDQRVRHSIGGQQQRASSLDFPMRRFPRARQHLQSLTLTVRHHQSRSSSTHAQIQSHK